MTASQPKPAEGGGIERVPPPPAGLPATEAGRRVVEPIPTIQAPPALFTEPPPAPTASLFIVPPPQTGAPPSADPVEETAETPPSYGWLTIVGGRTFQLLADRVLLGRDPVATSGEQEIVIVDPTRTVSKTHALLELVDDLWCVTDLGSVNGVVVFPRDGAERVLDSGIPEPVTARFLLGQVLIEISRPSTGS